MHINEQKASNEFQRRMNQLFLPVVPTYIVAFSYSKRENEKIQLIRFPVLYSGIWLPLPNRLAFAFPFEECISTNFVITLSNTAWKNLCVMLMLLLSGNRRSS